jgi:hypothetical protein
MGGTSNLFLHLRDERVVDRTRLALAFIEFVDLDVVWPTTG